MEQIVDVPVPLGRRRRSVSLQGSLLRQGSTAEVEQIVAFPVRGGLQGFLPGQGSPSSRFLQDEDDGFQGVFAHFSPAQKKCGHHQPSATVLGSVSSSELSAHQMAPAGEFDEPREDEPGDAMYAALEALRRLRRRGVWERRVEAEAAVQSSSPSMT